METFIVMAALGASLGGGVVLFSCLAGKRAQLVKAFNIQQEMKHHEKAKEEKSSQSRKKSPDDLPVVSGAAAE